jgi:hypothetical protein
MKSIVLVSNERFGAPDPIAFFLNVVRTKMEGGPLLLLETAALTL